MGAAINAECSEGILPLEPWAVPAPPASLDLHLEAGGGLRFLLSPSASIVRRVRALLLQGTLTSATQRGGRPEVERAAGRCWRLLLATPRVLQLLRAVLLERLLLQRVAVVARGRGGPLRCEHLQTLSLVRAPRPAQRGLLRGKVEYELGRRHRRRCGCCPSGRVARRGDGWRCPRSSQVTVVIIVTIAIVGRGDSPLRRPIVQVQQAADGPEIRNAAIHCGTGGVGGACCGHAFHGAGHRGGGGDRWT
jgi:hypothetical protein